MVKPKTPVHKSESPEALRMISEEKTMVRSNVIKEREIRVPRPAMRATNKATLL